MREEKSKMERLLREVSVPDSLAEFLLKYEFSPLTVSLFPLDALQLTSIFKDCPGITSAPILHSLLRVVIKCKEEATRAESTQLSPLDVATLEIEDEPPKEDGICNGNPEFQLTPMCPGEQVPQTLPPPFRQQGIDAIAENLRQQQSKSQERSSCQQADPFATQYFPIAETQNQYYPENFFNENVPQWPQNEIAQEISSDESEESDAGSYGGKRVKSGKKLRVLDFLLDLLNDERFKHVITWTKNWGEFHILKPQELSTLWGIRKGRLYNTSYHDFTRSLRLYYDKKLLDKPKRKPFVYRFLRLPGRHKQPAKTWNSSCAKAPKSYPYIQFPPAQCQFQHANFAPL